MTAADVALRQAGLVRVMASYQDGIPLALTRLSYFWKHQVTFAPGGFFNLGFQFTVPSSSTALSSSDLYLGVVDRRFPWHWAMRVGDDDACLAWGEFYKAELRALGASDESSVTCAVRYDRPIVVKWLLDQGFSVSSTAMQEAVKRSDVALFEQLCAATSQSIRGVVALTIFHGRLDLLEYLHVAFPTAVRTTGLYHPMMRSPSVAMLRFLHERVGARPSPADLLRAARSRNADVLDAVLSMLDPADALTMVQHALATQPESPAMQLLCDRSRRLGLKVVYSAGPATTDGSLSRDTHCRQRTPDHVRPDSAQDIARLADDRYRWSNVPRASVATAVTYEDAVWDEIFNGDVCRGPRKN